MPRPTLKVTEEFYQAVAGYQRQHNLKSWSQAVLELAAIGYKKETGDIPPKPYDPWGGKRSKDDPDQIDLKRLEMNCD